MKYVFAGIVLANAAGAATFAMQYIIERAGRKMQDVYFVMACFASALWSLGFGIMYMQESVSVAYICRSIGIFGTFVFMISGQALVASISEIKFPHHFMTLLFSIVSVVIYLLSIQPSQTSYSITSLGMSYAFTPGTVTILYNIHFVVITCYVFILTLTMLFKASKRRIRRFGGILVVFELFVMFGSIFDMAMPAWGYAAVPGSVITQFWGVIVLWIAVHANNRSRITVNNISDYIFTALDTPIVILDVNKRMTLLNSFAQKLLELTDDELENNDHFIEDYFSFGEENIFEFEGVDKHFKAVFKRGKIRYRVVLSKINDNYGDLVGYILSMTDLSEHYKSMEKLEDAKQSADNANRAKSVFLANMSHEIRTPMNAIMGFAELALQEQINDTARDEIQNIKSASKNLLGIINDILDISKIEAGKVELVNDNYNTSDLIEGVYSLIKTQTDNKGLDFTVDVGADVPSVMYGDRTKIREILINLLNNAVKYTKEGSVTLSVQMLGYNSGNAMIAFKIADTGMGIKKEALATLFESFVRVDLRKNANIEGTGLGLSIVKGYTELMGGKVKVESVYGKGSVFSAVIPQRVVDSNPIQLNLHEKTDEDDEFKIGNFSVNNAEYLVVDDNKVNLLVITRALEHYGAKVDNADSGKLAIEMCAKKDYAIVFMDQMMPEMDGVEAMKHIRELYPKYAAGSVNQIVALTANAIRGVKEELLAEGFDDYLEKPLNYKELERVLKK